VAKTKPGIEKAKDKKQVLMIFKFETENVS